MRDIDNNVESGLSPPLGYERSGTSGGWSLSGAWRQWRVVLGALIGTSIGAAPVMVISFGVFLKPVSSAFGWDRSVMSEGLFVAVLLNALATPSLGRLIDQYGVRRITLWAVAFFGAATASMSLMGKSWLLTMVLFGIWGLASTGQSQVPYVTAISATFERNRGLALGMGMCGLGIGAAIVPPTARLLLDQFGWRAAYALLGLLSGVVAYSAVFLLVHVPVSRKPKSPQLAANADKLSVYRIVSRSRHFWFLLIAVLSVSLATNGLFANFVPILTDAGMRADRAALIASSAGMATILGKVMSGFLVDRFHPQYVAAGSFLVPLIGGLILMSGHTAQYPMLLTSTVGFGVGAEVALAGTLVARFFGLRFFGQIFGFMAFAYTIGVGAGTVIMNAIYDRTGSYWPSFVVLSAALVLAAVLVGSLRDPEPLEAMQNPDGDGPDRTVE
jgi:predicted MFS family arabinose efflux permease